MKKIILVQPYYENIWEPIGLGFIIAYLKKHYVGELDIQCYQGNFDSDEVILEACMDADVVGFSCTSPAWPHALRLAEEIKSISPSTRTVFGGFHVSALPDVCIEYDAVDQIVVGEGEEAFLQIVNGCSDPIVDGTKTDMKEVPWPDRKIIKNHRTVSLCESMNGKRIASFQVNRVCPVACAFCAERVITGKYRKSNPVRTRSIPDALDEIDQVTKDLKLNYFKFVDATFDISPQFVIDFCKEKIRRGFIVALQQKKCFFG